MLNIKNYFNFINLPYDMKNVIIEFCDIKTIFNLTKTCKYLKDFCDKNIWWEKQYKAIKGFTIIHPEFLKSIKYIYFSLKLKKCFICHKETIQYEYSIIPCYICEDCATSSYKSDFQLIGINTIKCKYGMNYRDISSLKYIYHNNIKLFRKKDIKKIFIRLYKSRRNLQKKWKKSQKFRNNILRSTRSETFMIHY
jgi:hypothetical protein